MYPSWELLALIALGALSATCDDPLPQTGVTEQARALLDKAESEAEVSEKMEAEAEEVLSAPDEDDHPITVSWVADDSDKRALDADILSLKVQNHREDDAEIEVEVVFGGLLDESVTLDLGYHRLGGKQEIYLQVPADEIPIQTTKCICAAAAFAKATYMSNGTSWTAISGTDNLYYRHNPSYKGVKIFKEKVFLDQFGGRMVSLDDIIPDRGSVKDFGAVSMGWVKRGKERPFEEVKMSAAAGEPVAVGMGIEVVDLEEHNREMEEATNAR